MSETASTSHVVPSELGAGAPLLTDAAGKSVVLRVARRGGSTWRGAEPAAPPASRKTARRSLNTRRSTAVLSWC
jgi:hypothetical protein